MGASRREAARAMAGRIVLAYLLGGLAFVALSDLVLRHLEEIDQGRLRLASRLAFLAISGIFLAVVIGFALTRRRQAELELARIDQALSSLTLVNQSLAESDEQQLVTSLLAHVQSVLGADGVTVLIRGATDDAVPVDQGARADHDVLMVRGMTGRGTMATPTAITVSDESALGRVLTAREPLIVNDVHAAADVPLGPADTRSLIAQPLLVRREAIGVVYATAIRTNRFGSDELRLLGIIADRMASAIEQRRLFEAERRARLDAEHASEHLALVADAGRMLGLALEDVETAMLGLCDVLVPEFCDAAIVGTLDEAGLFEELVLRSDDPAIRLRLSAVITHRSWADAVGAAMVSAGARQLQLDGGGRDDLRGPLSAAGLETLALVPIRAPGHTYGVLACLRRSARGAFTKADVATLDDLAGRAARTVEAVNLYRDTEDAARAAEQRAEQLQDLADAATKISAAMTNSDLVWVLAEQARHVLRADGARVVVMRPAPAHVTVGDGQAAEALVVPLSGGVDGRVTVARHHGRPFDAHDRSMLVSLAQLGSVAIAHANQNRALQQGENRLRAVVESSPLGIIEVLPDGTIATANPAAAHTFSWDDGEDAGQRSFPSVLAADLADVTRRALNGETLLDLVFSMPRSDGRETSLSVSASPVRGTNGPVERIMLVVADETDRRELESQLRHAQRMDAVGSLAGGFAHNFNNLLTVILGYSELVARRLPDEQRADLDAVQAAAEQAKTMTDQLLTLSRHRVVQPVVLDPRKVIDEVSPVLERVIGTQIELVFDDDRDVGSVRIDPGQLEQVLINLVVNARDAIPPRGGQIVVSTELVPGTAGEPSSTVLRVSDTGSGMDATTVERAFEPFFSTKPRHEGTGLGLSTVYGIVTQAGGRVDIQSAVGEGTTVTITFPTVDGPVESVEQGPVTDEAPSGVERLLLVEDDDDVRSFARVVLAEEGYQVEVAADGAEALVSIDTNGPPDLVITDVVMPKMSGTELAREVRSRFPELPVLFMSGYAAEDGLEIGSAFLPKPFRRPELLKAVRTLLDQEVSDDARGDPIQGGL